MKWKILLTVIVFVFAAFPLSAQQVDEDRLLEWTSGTGVTLHRYHSAYKVAVETIRERAGVESLPPLYAGGPYDRGWAFSFGDLNDESEFILDYGVIVSGEGEVVQYDHFDFDRVASQHHMIVARALKAARDHFEEGKEEAGFTADEYRYAVITSPNRISVFISPNQTEPGVTLMGNEIMLVPSNDMQIERSTRFHRRLLKIPLKGPEEAIMPALMVPDSPMPSPFDVLNTIERGEKFAVVANRGVFIISPNGAINKLDEEDPMARDLLEYADQK